MCSVTQLPVTLITITARSSFVRLKETIKNSKLQTPKEHIIHTAEDTVVTLFIRGHKQWQPKLTHAFINFFNLIVLTGKGFFWVNFNILIS